MLFMNTYEIDEAVRRHAGDPVLGPAALTLAALRDAANANSDGWAYWPKPARAAEKLMDLLTRHSISTGAELKAALRPVKAFRTRHKLDFPIYDELPTGRELVDNLGPNAAIIYRLPLNQKFEVDITRDGEWTTVEHLFLSQRDATLFAMGVSVAITGGSRR